MCDSADAYVQKLGYLHLGDDVERSSGGNGAHPGHTTGSKPEAQVPVSSMDEQKQNQHHYHQYRESRVGNRSMSQHDNFIDESEHQRSGHYERENNSRYGPTKTTVDSIDEHNRGQHAPVYENIEYYPPAPPYYHSLDKRSPRASPRSSGAADYEPSFRKAQPQVPTGGGTKYTTGSGLVKELPPYEAPPVYENIQEIGYHDAGGDNKPGPQVPNYYHTTNINGGDYVVMTGKVN